MSVLQFSNNITATKIRAMYGKMLKEAQYLEILNCKDIIEIFNYLKNNVQYKKILKNLENENLNREMLEKMLRKQAFESFAKVFRYINKNKIISLVVEYFEIVEILKVISIIFSNSTKKYTIDVPEYFVKKMNIKIKNFSNVKTIDNLIEVLKNTKYSKILKKLVSENKNVEIYYLKYEHCLYLNFFKKLLDTIKSNSKNVELSELKKLIKTKIETINLCIIFRENILFKGNADTIKQKIFPFYKKLDEEKVNELLNCKNKYQMEEILKENFNKVKNFNLEEIEQLTAKMEFCFCKNKLHISSNITTVFYCFFVLKKIEISNLVAIIEGTHYKLKKKKKKFVN